MPATASKSWSAGWWRTRVATGKASPCRRTPHSSSIARSMPVAQQRPRSRRPGRTSPSMGTASQMVHPRHCGAGLRQPYRGRISCARRHHAKRRCAGAGNVRQIRFDGVWRSAPSISQGSRSPARSDILSALAIDVGADLDAQFRCGSGAPARRSVAGDCQCGCAQDLSGAPDRHGDRKVSLWRAGASATRPIWSMPAGDKIGVAAERDAELPLVIGEGAADDALAMIRALEQQPDARQRAGCAQPHRRPALGSDL